VAQNKDLPWTPKCDLSSWLLSDKSNIALTIRRILSYVVWFLCDGIGVVTDNSQNNTAENVLRGCNNSAYLGLRQIMTEDWLLKSLPVLRSCVERVMEWIGGSLGHPVGLNLVNAIVDLFEAGCRDERERESEREREREIAWFWCGASGHDRGPSLLPPVSGVLLH